MRYIRKIFVGFLYGTGFALGFFLIGLLLSYMDINTKRQPTAASTHNEPASSRKDTDEVDNISSISIKDAGSNMQFNGPEYLAVVKNNSAKKQGLVFVAVDLFDKNNNFIYKCGPAGIHSMKPGQSENIKISCHHINKSITDNISSYKIYVSEVH